jgi:hypothetical protein
MAEPNDAALPQGVELTRLEDGQIGLSPALVTLLIDARNGYDWPAGTGAAESQQTVIDLEADVAAFVNRLNPESAHAIIQRVSDWAGNNKKAHGAIVNATADSKVKMMNALNLLSDPAQIPEGLDALSGIPGINLVIASKVYRFCCPQTAAAVDRHASYFFNSLDIVSLDQGRAKATHFKREWSTGSHTYSRLATFTPGYYKRNRQEFTEVYLPLLVCVRDEMNNLHAQYTCAASGELRNWRPTDVEMAAYCWWASNGAR